MTNIEKRSNLPFAQVLAYMLLAFSLIMIPMQTRAGVLSLFGKTVGAAEKKDFSPVNEGNSQTIALLEANKGPAHIGDKEEKEISIVDNSVLAPQNSVLGSGADAMEDPSADLISIYTVKDGDTIATIAKMFDVTPETVAWANDMKKTQKLKAGDVLVILPISGIQHKVAKGETIEGIARKYKGSAKEIAMYNDLALDEKLAPGIEIIIPGGEADAPAQTPKKIASNSKSQSKSVGQVINGYFIKPVSGIITQRLHDRYGIDIGARTGTPIYASAGGTVVLANAGGFGGGYGTYSIIAHPNGTQTLYAHMSKIFVKRGQAVSQGQLIGYVGSTGRSTGPHLHFEIRGAKNILAGFRVGARI